MSGSRPPLSKAVGKATAVGAIALMLVSSTAFAADPPADAPLRSVHVTTGQAAPFSGRLLSDDEAVASERLCAADHAALAKAKDGVLLPPMAVVAIIAGALALGVATGVGVTLAAQRR